MKILFFVPAFVSCFAVNAQNSVLSHEISDEFKNDFEYYTRNAVTGEETYDDYLFNIVWYADGENRVFEFDAPGPDGPTVRAYNTYLLRVELNEDNAGHVTEVWSNQYNTVFIHVTFNERDLVDNVKIIKHNIPEVIIYK